MLNICINCNSAADMLSKEAVKISNLNVFFVSPPMWLLDYLYHPFTVLKKKNHVKKKNWKLVEKNKQVILQVQFQTLYIVL